MMRCLGLGPKFAAAALGAAPVNHIKWQKVIDQSKR
jgi:hypothetical protein